eukprot:11340830-Ditylum_brightwellii.AAC.1
MVMLRRNFLSGCVHVNACIVCCLTDLRKYVCGQWAVYNGNNWSQEEQCAPPSTTRGVKNTRQCETAA